jgi:hypothetical protein
MALAAKIIINGQIATLRALLKRFARSLLFSMIISLLISKQSKVRTATNTSDAVPMVVTVVVVVVVTVVINYKYRKNINTFIKTRFSRILATFQLEYKRFSIKIFSCYLFVIMFILNPILSGQKSLKYPIFGVLASAEPG